MYSAKRDGGRQLERSPVTAPIDMGEPLTARATA
jgi:hypothetical protein